MRDIFSFTILGILLFSSHFTSKLTSQNCYLSISLMSKTYIHKDDFATEFWMIIKMVPNEITQKVHRWSKPQIITVCQYSKIPKSKISPFNYSFSCEVIRKGKVSAVKFLSSSVSLAYAVLAPLPCSSFCLE